MPKAKKGRVTVPVHPICHRTIHALYANAALARFGADREALVAEPAMSRFLALIANKPPDFHAPTRR